MGKKNINYKTWNKIKCADGTYKTDIYSILKEQTTFYQSLFKPNDFNNTDADYLDKELNEQESTLCDSDVLEEEILKVI